MPKKIDLTGQRFGRLTVFLSLRQIRVVELSGNVYVIAEMSMLLQQSHYVMEERSLVDVYALNKWQTAIKLILSILLDNDLEN